MKLGQIVAFMWTTIWPSFIKIGKETKKNLLQAKILSRFLDMIFSHKLASRGHLPLRIGCKPSNIGWWPSWCPAALDKMSWWDGKVKTSWLIVVCCNKSCSWIGNRSGKYEDVGMILNDDTADGVDKLLDKCLSNVAHEEDNADPVSSSWSIPCWCSSIRRSLLVALYYPRALIP